MEEEGSAREEKWGCAFFDFNVQRSPGDLCPFASQINIC